eukprot:s2395_g2.t1
MDIPWPTKLRARAPRPAPVDLFKHLANKLEVPAQLRTCGALVPCYWAMPTDKSNPEAIDWTDLLALALELEHAPSNTGDVMYYLLLHAQYRDDNKVCRIAYAWSSRTA